MWSFQVNESGTTWELSKNGNSRKRDVNEESEKQQREERVARNER